MQMNNIMNGNKTLRINEVTSRPNAASNGSGVYMNSPISMKMDMHMFGAMYAPLNQLTLILLIPRVFKIKISGGLIKSPFLRIICFFLKSLPANLRLLNLFIFLLITK